jgi:hypothetical protein
MGGLDVNTALGIPLWRQSERPQLCSARIKPGSTPKYFSSDGASKQPRLLKFQPALNLD